MGRGRAPCCDKSKVKRGPWSPAEDLRLINFVQKNGHSNWRALPKQAGLLRCGKSCRLRWINYLRPDVKRGNFTPEEEQIIINLHNSFGNKWSKIASCLPGRTDNEIKNVWNTHLKKRLIAKKVPIDSQKTATNNSKKTKCSTSPSSSSSSITISEDQDTDRSITISEDQGTERSITISEDQDTEQSHHDQKFEESDVMELDATPELNQTASYDSLASTYGSNFSSTTSGPDNASGTNELSAFSRPETIIFPDNEEIVIPIFESDTNIWELLDSLDPLQSTESEQNGTIQDSNHSNHEENLDNDDECKKWLSFLEDELGLTSDSDSVPKDLQDHVIDPTPNPPYQGTNFEAEINPQLHNFPIWSENLDI